MSLPKAVTLSDKAELMSSNHCPNKHFTDFLTYSLTSASLKNKQLFKLFFFQNNQKLVSWAILMMQLSFEIYCKQFFKHPNNGSWTPQGPLTPGCEHRPSVVEGQMCCRGGIMPGHVHVKETGMRQRLWIIHPDSVWYGENRQNSSRVWIRSTYDSFNL